MKKYLILFIIAAVIISAGLLIFNRSPYTIDTPYEYPDDEKNIPVEIIEKMTTEALLESYIYNEAIVPNYGEPLATQFRKRIERSDALGALLERDDLIEAIYNVYKPLEVYMDDLSQLSFEEQSKIYAEMDILTHIEFICSHIKLDGSTKESVVKLRELLDEKHQQKLIEENGQICIKFPPGYDFLKGGRGSTADWFYIP